MRRIGIMGGTFNPIHFGHLLLAECAREEYALDEIWLIPTGCSYLKEEQRKIEAGTPSPEERLEMTCLAVEGLEGFRCLDIEVKREGYTYTYETLEELKSKYPQDEFFFIVGADCLDTIETWRYPERIFASCQLIAATRGDRSIDEMAEKAEQLRDRLGARIRLMPFRNLEISSSDIRARVGGGKSIRFMTPQSVISYIEEKRFYRK